MSMVSGVLNSKNFIKLYNCDKIGDSHYMTYWHLLLRQ